MLDKLRNFLLMSLLPLVRRGSRCDASRFQDVGFHGDKYLLTLVDHIMQRAHAFVETGADVGSTLAYVARTYPHAACLSCEPDPSAFETARENTAHLPNVAIFRERSQEFLKRLKEGYAHLFQQDVLFWLDAHGGGFTWPLKEELTFVTTHFRAAYILIDDFKVPGLDCFEYDRHRGQECSFEYIEDALSPELEYSLYYPNYTERTSTFHPLRGWALIEFGHGDQWDIPDSVCKIRRGWPH